MRIAIVGAHGQLGTALQSALARETVLPLGHAEIDIADPHSVHAALGSLAIDCLINAAAYNFVDRAEDEPEAAQRVNAIGPQNLALFCREAGIPFVHVSTDYVFGADTRPAAPYRETDPPAPACAYARSKLAGEELVRAAWERHFIVRTCGLYGRAQSAGKGNFVKTMLRLADQRPELTVVDDQHCTPSSANDVSDALARLIRTDAYGLYHATNAGDTTWYGFACEVFRISGKTVRVRPVGSADYPQKAERPRYSVLDCSKLAATIGRALPPWQDGLTRYVNDLARGGPI